MGALSMQSECTLVPGLQAHHKHTSPQLNEGGFQCKNTYKRINTHTHTQVQSSTYLSGASATGHTLIKPQSVWTLLP